MMSVRTQEAWLIKTSTVSWFNQQRGCECVLKIAHVQPSIEATVIERPTERVVAGASCIPSRNPHNYKAERQEGTHLIPRSMCSWIPNPKHPVSLKFRRSSSYSFTFNPLSRSCVAFSPRTVT